MAALNYIRNILRRDRIFEFMIPKPVKNPKLRIGQGCLLYVEGVTVSFDGFKALDDLNLYIDDGELRCIIGPNGAGKTTLMDVITGKTLPEEGSVLFGQNIDLLKMKEQEIVEAGIGRKFQRPTVFQELTVMENLELAMHTDKKVWHSLFTYLSEKQLERIEEILEFLALQDHRHQTAGLLSHGQKQWLEIGMLLMQNPKLLFLDEPVAGMTPHEIERTGELLSSMVPEHTVVVIDHDMDFIRSIAKRVTVLHEGHVLAEGSMKDIQSNPQVIEVYLGEE